MLPVFHAEDALVGMTEIRSRDIDCIDLRTRGHLLQRCEQMRNPVPDGKGLRGIHIP